MAPSLPLGVPYVSDSVIGAKPSDRSDRGTREPHRQRHSRTNLSGSPRFRLPEREGEGQCVDSDAADADDVVVLIVSLEGTVEWCSLTGVLARLSRPLSVRRDERRAPSSSSDPMRDSNGIQPSAISVPGYSSSTVNSKH